MYVCLWSHAGWEPVHIHFVLQPVRNDMKSEFTAAGPTLQSEMFMRSQSPDRGAVEDYCDRMRSYLGAG